MSGYTPCACRDCFEVSISGNVNDPDLCAECEESGCDVDGESECQRDDAYGVDCEAS